MPYKSFDDFSEVTLKFGEPGSFNYGYVANPKFEVESSPLFDDSFFIMYRRSEFAAQKECAMADIYKFLTGYGPEVYVVKDKDNNFFAASRGIKKFKDGLGFFKEKNTYENAVNLAALHVIAYFFCESDMHDGNYGTQTESGFTRVFKIDNAESLDFYAMRYGINLDTLQQLPYTITPEFDGVSEIAISKSIVLSEEYQREKLAMLEKIANTDFDEFAAILDKHLTVDEYSKIVSTVDLMIQHCKSNNQPLPNREETLSNFDADTLSNQA